MSACHPPLHPATKPCTHLSPWAFWLRPKDVEIARERTAQFRRSDNKKFTWQTVKRTVRSPLLYFFATMYPAAVLAQAGYQCEPDLESTASSAPPLTPDFSLFLKSLKNADGSPVWTVAQVNAIPIGA